MAEFNFVTGLYEGYDAYTAGAGASAGGSSVNWGGFGNTLVDLAKVYGGIEVAKNRQTPLYQVGPNGQMYREGVPIGQASGGGISPLLLLLLAGVAIFALKD